MPTVTALQATPVALRGDVVKMTTIARTTGTPMNSAAVCWSPWSTTARYARDAAVTARTIAVSATRGFRDAAATSDSVAEAASTLPKSAQTTSANGNVITHRSTI